MIPRSKKEKWEAAKKRFLMSRKQMRSSENCIYFRVNGVWSKRHSVTNAALLKKHAYGQCDFSCSFCWQESCDEYEQDIKLQLAEDPDYMG